MGKNFGGRVYISSSENARDKDNGYVFDFDIINENDSNSEMIERKQLSKENTQGDLELDLVQ